MFGAIKAFFIMQLPFAEPERLFHVEYANPTTGDDSIEVNWFDYLEMRRHQRSFEDLAAWSGGTINLSADETPERLDGIFMTANALDVLGVKPILGRGFEPADGAFGAPAAVMIGHNLWRNRFNADPGIVGREVRVNGRAGTVVGVMPAGFKFPINNEIWIPQQRNPQEARGESVTVEVFGRALAGTNLEQARADLSRIMETLAKSFPDTNAGLVPVVKPYKDEYVGDVTKRIVLTMFAAVILVLLIACANVANLILARSTDRTREFAVRTAMGASRMRLVMSMLSETLVIALIGATLGMGIAQLGLEAMDRALLASEDPPPYFVDFSLDWRVAAFAFGIALVTAFAAGLIPALRASRFAVHDVLKDAGRGSSGVGLTRLTRGLVIGEIALSCVLLVCAGLTVRSTLKATDLDLGADISGILSGRIGLFEEVYPTPADRLRFFERLEAKLGELPGVKSVAITTSLPLTFMGGTAVLAEGQTPPESANRYPFVGRIVSTPGLFDTLGVRLREGRNFTTADRADTALVAIVNPAFVETYLKDRPAIGARIRVDVTDEKRARDVTVVGVVNHIRHEGDDLTDIDPTVYLPLAQDDARFASFAVKVEGDPYALSGAVRRAVLEIDRDLPVYWLRTLEDWLSIALFDFRLIGTLFGIFAAFALLLSAAGIYAVLAFAVGTRTREIGVRRALGAQDRGILRMVLGQGTRQLTIGLGIGLVLAAGFAQALSAVLLDISTFDPVTYLAVLVVLAAATVLASAVPAWRALRVDPMEALRYE
jgi:predicted permease